MARLPSCTTLRQLSSTSSPPVVHTVPSRTSRQVGGNHRVLILGGYGTFGSMITTRLSREGDAAVNTISRPLDIIIAGRSLTAAQKLANQLQRDRHVHHGTYISGVAMDIGQADLQQRIEAEQIDTVVHTCGPFMAQNYKVAEAAIAAGANYIDLADDTTFVAGITRALDSKARAAGVLATSGASTVPALTSAVVDAYRPYFNKNDGGLQMIRSCITPGNQSPRGIATIRSVLAYCGRSYRSWQHGTWSDVIGWDDQRSISLRGVEGRRLVANINVPDLVLFPARYPGLMHSAFQAGLEYRPFMWGLSMMKWAAQQGLIKSWVPAAEILKFVSELVYYAGTDEGGMTVEMQGHDGNGRSIALDWHLYAGKGHGPQIPSTAAVVLVQKLARGELGRSHRAHDSSTVSTMDGTYKAAIDLTTGARPCVGMIRLDEFMYSLRHWDIMATVNGLTHSPVDGKPTPIVDTSDATPTPSSSPIGGYRDAHDLASSSHHSDTPSWAISSMGSLAVSSMPSDFRRFNTTGGTVAGDLFVTRNSNPLISALATLVGIPAATPSGARGSRCIVTSTAQQQWTRQFNGVPMTTQFTTGRHMDGTAREISGPFQFIFHMIPLQPSGGFAHITKSMRAFGIRMPTWAMVRADGRSTPLKGDKQGWNVEVEVTMPFIGLLARYDGNVYPITDASSSSSSVAAVGTK